MPWHNLLEGLAVLDVLQRGTAGSGLVLIELG